MPQWHIGGVEEKLHSFLALVLEEHEWLNFTSLLIYSRERTAAAIEQKAGWVPETIGTFLRRENCWPYQD
jgi:hypothetical protein